MELVLFGPLFCFILVVTLLLAEWAVGSETHWAFLPLFVLFGVLLAFTPSLRTHVTMDNIFSMYMLKGVMIYVSSGIIWGFAKWGLHLLNERDYIEKNLQSLKDRFTTANAKAVEAPTRGYTTYATFTDYLESERLISRAINNKFLISIWMVWWPFSILWSVFHDLLRRLYNYLIDTFMWIFNAINNRIFGKFNA